MTHSQSEPTTETRHAPPPEIAGRSWQVSGSVAKCAVPPHARPPHEAQAVTPHPTKPGWKLAWLFLPALCVIACLGIWLVCQSASIGAVVLL